MEEVVETQLIVAELKTGGVEDVYAVDSLTIFSKALMISSPVS